MAHALIRCLHCLASLTIFSFLPFSVPCGFFGIARRAVFAYGSAVDEVDKHWVSLPRIAVTVDDKWCYEKCMTLSVVPDCQAGQLVLQSMLDDEHAVDGLF